MLKHVTRQDAVVTHKHRIKGAELDRHLSKMQLKNSPVRPHEAWNRDLVGSSMRA